MINCEICEQTRPMHADDCPRVLYASALRVDPEED